MNSRRSWPEIFEMLDGPLSVLSEGERVPCLESRLSHLNTLKAFYPIILSIR
jgi:hypothetical protein